MVGSSSGGSGSSNPGSGPQAPKILLAKPGLARGSGEDETVSLRSRLPPIASLNLLSDSWEFHTDRFLPFLTENTDFTVVGVIGPPGVGKSMIMNQLYGFDGSSPGMLPPFTVQSEEIRATARHCTVGIEPRISAERLILLDTQPVFSPSVLAEMMRPDGSSTISVLTGESLSAELAHEIMGIQLGVLLASICHILLVVSEGVHDNNMWRLMLTIDLLKHGIPDPSSVTPHSQSSNSGSEKETKVYDSAEYMAAPIFVQTKLQDQDLTQRNYVQLKNALAKYFDTCWFMRNKYGKRVEHDICTSVGSSIQNIDRDSAQPNLFLIPFKNKDDSPRALYESYISALWKMRDQVLSMNSPSFARSVSEREWLKNSAKLWELVKKSPIIVEYCKTLQSLGMFRR